MLLDSASPKKNNIKPWQDTKVELAPQSSHISRQFSDILATYKKLTDESVDFFSGYKSDYQQLNDINRTLRQNQLLLNQIKAQHKGKLRAAASPSKIPVKSVARLEQQVLDLKKQYRNLNQRLNQAKQQRWYMLDKIVRKMLTLLISNKSATQLLGTILLSAPLPEEKVRCSRNERYKPLYIAALVTTFFQHIQADYTFEDDYIREVMDALDADIPKEEQSDYKEDILAPLISAMLLQTIGSYAPEAENIFRGDRFRALNKEERKLLNKITKQKSLEYIQLALGVPEQKFVSRQESELYQFQQTKRLQFMQSLILHRDKSDYELRDLMQIPMVYTSYLLSTKPEFEYDTTIKAYQTIEMAITRKLYFSDYAKRFLNLVGRFPLGCGIYFYSEDTNTVEKAIVCSLQPEHADEPVCKQITRYQMQSLSHSEIVVSRKNNVFFPTQSTKQTGRALQAFLKTHKTPIWNANEVWDVQVPSSRFWSKDGQCRYV
ncbi:hypothetical protein C2869_10500 [Saccharobesus litoralis]|uniref:Uncharacterized protein n=1 Tax=Saccharobesus litoralis TaxID=2172099 RepID=A0A2S0VRK9_9ALTE|nr:hypothetical protein [Saccharobesus litoralis]AWB66834.1 hypothetical protein C2869_10500 [Saccharobesus litoralis]